MIPESSSMVRLTRAERAEARSQLFNLGDQFFVTATSLLDDFAGRAFHKRRVVEPRREASRFVFLTSHLLYYSLAFLFEVDQAPERHRDLHSGHDVARYRFHSGEPVGDYYLFNPRQSLYLVRVLTHQVAGLRVCRPNVQLQTALRRNI